MKGISRSGSLGMLPPPLWAGQSHVEILDSNRACESAAGFQSCAHDPISIPMLRPFAENWPHAIALPHKGGREHTEVAARMIPFVAHTVQLGFQEINAPRLARRSSRCRPGFSTAA